MAARKVAFVTAREIGGIEADDRLTARELEALGVDAVPAFWDEPPRRDVEAFVVRSPWDYHLQPEAFLAWIDDAARTAVVHNAPATLRWNAHKAYLNELAAAGISVTPTVVCKRGKRHDLAAVLSERGWHEAVVKPAISASSYMTAIVGATPHPALRSGDLDARFLTDGQSHLEAILASRDALVQPFMPEIFTRGERSLIYFDGVFSHCIQKNAFNAGPGLGAAVSADAAERALAEAALRFVAQTPLYARVDILRDASGVERLMELELLDPELYVRFDPGAPRAFAEAIVKRMNVGVA